MDEGVFGGVDNSQAVVVRRLEDDDANEGARNELLQMQRIRELDMEPLEVEEDDDSEADNSNDSRFFSSLHRFYSFVYQRFCAETLVTFLNLVALAAYQ